MQDFVEAATVLLPLAYLLVAIDHGLLFFAATAPFARRTATWALIATLLLHLASLVAATVFWRQVPLFTGWQALSSMAFAVAVVCAFLERRGRARSIGFWLLSLVFVCQLSSLLTHLLTRPEPPSNDVFRDHFDFGD